MTYGLAIATICLFLASLAESSRAGSALLPNPQSLPPAHQTHDRILAVMTLAEPGRRPDRLTRQLDHFVAACESGFEVHVVITTLQSNWTSVSHLFEPTRNLCLRLMADIPVALSVQQSHLAARHREVFASKIGMYDYYLSHEDDILYKTHHFQYFKHWSHTLRSMPLLHPGFLLFEVPTHYVTPVSLLTYTPAISFDPWRSVHLLKWRGHLLAVLQFGHAASYMVTDAQLRRYSKFPAWLGAKDVEWGEFNIPFQGQFLSDHVFRVVPIAHLNRAMVHHTSDKYMNMDLHNHMAQVATLTHETRLHGLDIMWEILHIVRKCTGLAIDAPPDITPPYSEASLTTVFNLVGHPEGTVHPCSICFNKGEAVRLQLNVTSIGGSLLHNEDNTTSIPPSSARIKVECKTEIAKQSTHGCGKTDGDCAARNESFWGGPLLEMSTSLEKILAERF